MAKKNEAVSKYRLTTYKSDENGRTTADYSTLAEAQSAMRTDYDAELQYCVEHGEQPTTAYISTWSAYISGTRKCQWRISEI